MKDIDTSCIIFSIIFNDQIYTISTIQSVFNSFFIFFIYIFIYKLLLSKLITGTLKYTNIIIIMLLTIIYIFLFDIFNCKPKLNLFTDNWIFKIQVILVLVVFCSFVQILLIPGQG